MKSLSVQVGTLTESVSIDIQLAIADAEIARELVKDPPLGPLIKKSPPRRT